LLIENNNFIDINRIFWDRFKEPDINSFVLVETSYHPVINHANAVVGKMISHAKNLRISWIEFERTDKEILRSYSANSRFLKFKKLPIMTKLWFIAASIYYYVVYILLTNRIHSFKYRGIPYGDFIYDGYLARYSMATLHRFDTRIARVFFTLLMRDEQARAILNEYPIEAVLVSHYIGMGVGPLSRVAMQKNIPVYGRAGGHEIFNFYVLKNLKQMYDYPKKPSQGEVDSLVKDYKNSIEEDFKNFIEGKKDSSFSVFSIAYNNNIESDKTRENFLKDFSLPDKPLIFIMLHAFNDYPHSSFKSMLFRDYYDWFVQTYRFALNDKSKNWIFKEHPASRFYPTKDISLKKMMQGLPAHMKFIPEDSVINAAVVLNVADLIVTCVGTAGVEMPALRGIPTVIAGDTFYDKLGFTIEPKSRKEYFNILANLIIEPLSAEQQLRAQCCFLYLNKYCMMPFSAGPAITVEEIGGNPPELKETYPIRIMNVYKEKEDLIYREFIEYANAIKDYNFVKLVRLPTKGQRL